MTPKESWKKLYRLCRIIRRENLKAVEDTMLYGTGIVYIPDKGEPYHIPIQANIILPQQNLKEEDYVG